MVGGENAVAKRLLVFRYRNSRVTKDIAAGLAHMHRKGVAHCDVKPENVLLFSGDFTAKLSDFGISLGGCDMLSECLECGEKVPSRFMDLVCRAG